VRRHTTLRNLEVHHTGTALEELDPPATASRCHTQIPFACEFSTIPCHALRAPRETVVASSLCGKNYKGESIVGGFESIKKHYQSGCGAVVAEHGCDGILIVFSQWREVSIDVCKLHTTLGVTLRVNCRHVCMIMTRLT